MIGIIHMFFSFLYNSHNEQTHLPFAHPALELIMLKSTSSIVRNQNKLWIVIDNVIGHINLCSICDFVCSRHYVGSVKCSQDDLWCLHAILSGLYIWVLCLSQKVLDCSRVYRAGFHWKRSQTICEVRWDFFFLIYFASFYK